MTRILCALLIFPFLSVAAWAEAKPVAVLQGLDKVTARVTTFQVAIDQPFDFGALRIRVRHCDRTPPQLQPEATAFLEIDEVRYDGEQQVLFTGWMFASSPGLNAVEHAVYDVWVIDCIDTPAAESSPAESSADGIEDGSAQSQ